MSLQIDEMFAFIAADANGDEGVCGFHSHTGWMPLVGADIDRMESLRPIAQEIADASGTTITLARFLIRQDTDTIRPRQARPDTNVTSPDGSER